MVVIGLAKDNNYYILDMVRDRLNPTERIDILFELHKKWNKKAGKPPIVISEQYGMMTDNFFLKKRQEELNYRFAVKEVGGSVKKEDRIRKVIPLFESKRVFLPRKIMYGSITGEVVELVQKFVDEELVLFPVGRHDDLLDAFSRICETEVRAAFPSIETIYLQPGQSMRDYLGGNNKDYMSW
jgi:predicted phage terminase large subunit-like protein